MHVLSRIINGCQIMACAFIDGDAENGIAVLAVDIDGGIYVTAKMRLLTDIDWMDPHYTHFADRAWRDFFRAANKDATLE